MHIFHEYFEISSSMGLCYIIKLYYKSMGNWHITQGMALKQQVIWKNESESLNVRRKSKPWKYNHNKMNEMFNDIKVE